MAYGITYGLASKILRSITFLQFKYELILHNVDQHGKATCEMRILFNAPNTLNRTETAQVYKTKPVDLQDFISERDFILHVYEITVSCLRHEASELFKIGELAVFDEHDDKYYKAGKWTMIQQMFTLENEEPYPFGSYERRAKELKQ